MIDIYGIPEKEQLSRLYRVSAGGVDVPVRYCHVSAMPYNTVWPGCQRSKAQTEEAGFVSLAVDGPAELEVVVADAQLLDRIASDPDICVRPRASGASAVLSGGTLKLSIPGPGYYTLECGGYHNCLHIFADAYASDWPRREDVLNATYRFEHGRYNAGVLRLRSGDSLYVGADAVVYATVIAEHADNVRIFGRGILDNSLAVRDSGACLPFGSLHITDCRNVTVEGVTFRDSACWTATVRASDNVLFDGVKLIGMWRYNTDGIDLVNSRNCIIRNSFLRNFDDVVVLKGLKGSDTRNVENIYVEGCTLWCDWGRALEIGAETCADEYRNIVFENIDIIHGDCILMDLQNGDRASVHGITFKNIRCEYTKYQLTPVYQSDLTAPYAPPEGLFVPVLFNAHLYCGMWSNDMLYGENYDILLENIEVSADNEVPVPRIALCGVNEEHRTYGITVKGLYFNGKKLDAEEVPVTLGAFAEAPKII